jgi:Ca2+-binding EF-hand superfamily protein
LYGFLSHTGFDATDSELIAIIRRIEGGGNQKVDFDEFVQALEPIFIKMHDV